MTALTIDQQELLVQIVDCELGMKIASSLDLRELHKGGFIRYSSDKRWRPTTAGYEFGTWLMEAKR